MLHEMIVMLNDSRVLIVRVDAARMAVSSDDSCRCSMERLEHLCKGRKGRTKEFYISQLIYPGYVERGEQSTVQVIYRLIFYVNIFHILI